MEQNDGLAVIQHRLDRDLGAAQQEERRPSLAAAL
jgi:hypothetical protein